MPAALNEQLCPGDVIHVGERSRVEVTVVNQPNVRLDQNTALSLAGDDQPLRVRLLYGAAYFFSRHPRRLTVDTPFIDAAVEGTEFLVRVEAERTLIIVFAGRIRASNPHGELAIADGEAALAEAGRAPAPISSSGRATPCSGRFSIRRSCRRWPILRAPPRKLAEPLRGAVALAATGQLPAAFARFEAIPETERGSDFYLYRAATLLSVGRVEEARADIGQALLRDPSDGRADALSAVIAVAQNDRDRALADAQRAVELSPRSAAARIALSYAEQAQFRIEQAREAMQQAVKDEPENALAWARLSELWLMQGRRDRARKAAKQARELAPELARSQTVLGFAELAEINTGRAKRAFRRAIDIDSAESAAPLRPRPRHHPRRRPREGPARHRDRGGARPEQLAAAQLSRQGLLRRADHQPADLLRAVGQQLSQSGKHARRRAVRHRQAARSERSDAVALRRHPLAERKPAGRGTARHREVDRAERQPRRLPLARAARPGPGGARHQPRPHLQRSGLRAARHQRGDEVAELSIPATPGRTASSPTSTRPSPAARSRASASCCRRSCCRTSTSTRCSRALSETNLNIITGGGPARPGFNEFTPLFERNQAQLNLSGEVGNNNTWADEAVVSGLYDRFP